MAPAPARLDVAGVARDLVSLTKPRVVSLLVLTGAASALAAAGGWPGGRSLAAVVVGGGLAAGGAGALNCALEGDLDRSMARTRGRPVAAGRVSPTTAAGFGIALNGAAMTILILLANPLAALLALAGSAWYVLVYTIWLKRRTPQNIVVGGAAGSFPPLVGWAAVTGGLDATALALAAVIFLWTPPHFWSLAALLESDYRRAEVPMLPVVAGPAATARRMSAYAAATGAASLAPLLWGGLGLGYAAVAVVGGGWFLALCLRHRRRPGPATARGVFLASVAYLFLLFAAAAADRWAAAAS